MKQKIKEYTNRKTKNKTYEQLNRYRWLIFGVYSLIIFLMLSTLVSGILSMDYHMEDDAEGFGAILYIFSFFGIIAMILYSGIIYATVYLIITIIYFLVWHYILKWKREAMKAESAEMLPEITFAEDD